MNRDHESSISALRQQHGLRRVDSASLPIDYAGQEPEDAALATVSRAICIGLWIAVALLAIACAAADSIARWFA